MNKTIPQYGALFLSAVLASSSSFATSATGIGSFEGEEEPTVRYIVSSGSFATGDTYDNLTNATNGLRATLRYRAGDWWDGDRATTNDDRQRAEVKGLGVHQKNGETFEYKSTWRTNSSFAQAGHFCHIFQLKATDGDNGAPLITQSLDNGGNNGAVQHWSGSATGFTNARTFTYTAGQAKTVNVRVKVSTSSDGLVTASIDGGSFSGATNLAIYRPQATDYRPKWGLYRGVDSNDPIGDDYVEHTNVTSNEVTDGGGGGGITGFKRIVARHSSKDVVVQSASTADGANVFQYTYSSGTTRNDEWEIISIGSGYYRVMNRHSGKALTVQGASTANGANVIQYTYGGSQTNDEWAIEDVGGGYYRFINRHSGKALDVLNSGTGNSVNIQQDAPDGGTNQQFQLISI